MMPKNISTSTLFEKLPFDTILITVVAIAIVIFMINQINEEEELKQIIFNQKLSTQFAYNLAITENVQHDFSIIQDNLFHIISHIDNVDQLDSDRIYYIMEDGFENISVSIPTIALFLTDENGIILQNVRHDNKTFVGESLAHRKYIQNIQSTLKPQFSTNFSGLDNSNQITISLPIINENKNLKGIIGLAISTEDVFKRHVNILNIVTQFITIIDKDKKIISHPEKNLVNINVFEEKFQQSINYNEKVNKNLNDLFEGKMFSSVVNVPRGEFLATGVPILFDENLIYGVIILSPTSSFFSEIENQLLIGQQQTIIFLSIMVSVIVIFIIIRNKIIKRNKIIYDLEKQSEQLKNERLATVGQLTSRIAHDLRNPLSSIKNTVEIMEIEFEKKLNENMKENLERLKRGISRLSHDVEDVLDFVKVVPLKIEKTSLRSVIDASIDRIDVNSIKMKLPQNDIEIFCDPDKLEIAFINILQNAVDAIDKNGQIEIRFIDNHSEVIIEFEDNGITIPEEILSKIFEPLFTTKMKGIGLGLVTTRNIVEQHKGTITVKNNPVTFTVKLPKNPN